MALAAGTRLGPYEVIAPLGAGGMGEVYRARDHRLGREVALKTLPDRLLADPERRARFEREARALAAMTHPVIATLHEIGESDGRPFLVMELVEGQTLSQRLADGPMPLAGSLALAAQLADGLAAAHARGIVHRDLKPSNLIITPDGRLKIVDFGLAKTGLLQSSDGGLDTDLSLSPTAVAITGTGMMVGTVGFMSPEQVRGQRVDGRADIWAFGCILFELLSGKRAFAGASPWEVVAAVMGEQPDWSQLPPRLHPTIETIVRRCLEKDPKRRLADLAEARAALSGDSPSATTWVSVPVGARLLARSRRRGARWVIGAAAALLVLTLCLVWWWKRQPAAPVLPSLAILPFKSLGGGGPDAQWLGEGLSAAVSARLADVDGVRVFPAASTIEAVQGGADAMGVAKLLGADMVLGGTVQRAGEDVRLIFTLLAAPAGNQLAAGTVSSRAGSLFQAQDELAGEVLAAIDVARPAPPKDDSGLPLPAQQDRYLRALGLLQRYDQASSVEAAIALLETLAKEAPDSPLVHAALGRAFLRRFTLTHEAS
ncbi:MAG TPA: serine/threonine-protein kinase, partial [Thermoanaerobaculia bacterium]|nr:serine/threonine-protein kinase [Thermoanaerobaculia bacterium]